MKYFIAWRLIMRSTLDLNYPFPGKFAEIAESGRLARFAGLSLKRLPFYVYSS